LVEIEGFETFYTEDIADVIEKYTDGIVENYNSRLADNVKKELSAKYSFDKCTVKLIDRKINTAKIPGFNSAVVHSERHLNENNYLYGIC
jgi:phosphopantetheine adenylyltransferase